MAASLSILPDRHTLPDMILSALRECCMLFGILIYMSMPLSEALGLAKDDQDDNRRDMRLVAIFPALLAMLVFPLVWHDATFASFAGGSLHLYLFGLCKVAMILSYQCLDRKGHLQKACEGGRCFLMHLWCICQKLQVEYSFGLLGSFRLLGSSCSSSDDFRCLPGGSRALSPTMIAATILRMTMTHRAGGPRLQ